MEYEQLIRAQFKVYYRQQDAIDHQDVESDARVFPFEIPRLGQGRRKFICTTPTKFFDFYQSFKAGRHFYELIQDGYPCRPYFDLEFYTQFNPTLDPALCFQDFISICKEAFADTLNIHLDDTNFMVLDSTTDEKYSAHVIVHLPNNQLFPSNLALKPLIQIICGKMQDSRRCIVQTERGEDFLCDRSVYSKNRNFRMYYSSKVGKSKKLQYADYCKFYAVKPPGDQLFYDTMIVPKNLDEHQSVNMEPLVEYCQLRFYRMDMPKSMGPKASSYQIVRCNSQSDDLRTLAQGTGTSMFPELDNFVLSLMRPLCPSVQIRKWNLVYCEKFRERRIVYYFANCRFCYNILREHKSQNVYWTIVFENFSCFQKCFDYECRLASRYFQIPYQVEEKAKRKVDQIFAGLGIEPPRPKQEYYEILVPSMLIF